MYHDFIETLKSEFVRNAHPENAAGQKAYMKNHFEFLGLSAPLRRELQKAFLVSKYLPPKVEMEKIVKQLWQEPYREYQYFAQELAYKYLSKQAEEDIDLYEYMITHKSWWDTVDFIAPKLVGTYFKTFPDKRKEIIDKWLKSQNIWLQRASVLFQLKYKEQTDIEFLVYIINYLSDSQEFFINKAVGWVLREYAKTNPDWVVQFVNNTPQLHKLAKKEALRIINKNIG